ncbi:MAG: hypothetical protein WD770_03650 [Actinomycetota bacterium]
MGCCASIVGELVRILETVFYETGDVAAAAREIDEATREIFARAE